MKINYLISLGCSCNVATYLKKLNIKKCSYPFDWIFSNLKMIQDVIDDDFKKFMDKSNFIVVKPSATGHKIYHKQMFNHHNPLIKENYKYFERCINRFNNIINSPKGKLFVHTTYADPTSTPLYKNQFIEPYNQYIVESINDFINFYKYLQTKTKNFKLLIIVQIPFSKQPQIQKIDAKIDDLHIYNLYLKGPCSGLLFDNEIDNQNCIKIFNSFDYAYLE